MLELATQRYLSGRNTATGRQELWDGNTDLCHTVQKVIKFSAIYGKRDTTWKIPRSFSFFPATFHVLSRKIDYLWDSVPATTITIPSLAQRVRGKAWSHPPPPSTALLPELWYTECTSTPPCPYLFQGRVKRRVSTTSGTLPCTAWVLYRESFFFPLHLTQPYSPSARCTVHNEPS